MVGTITVVGVGPGDPAFVTQKVRGLVECSEVLAGFRKSVEAVELWALQAEKLLLDYRNQEQGLDELAQRARDGKRCIVCCYGDPNVSEKEFLAQIRRRWPEVVIIPGISSIQMACARAGVAVEDTLFVTLHRRYGVEDSLEELVESVLAKKRNTLILPRPWDLMPAGIAKMLLERGASSVRDVLVYERLSLPGESSLHATLAGLASSEHKFSDLTVMLVKRDEEAT